MSRKQRSGFKAPRDYDPRRGKAQKQRKSDSARKKFGGNDRNDRFAGREDRRSDRRDDRRGGYREDRGDRGERGYARHDRGDRSFGRDDRRGFRGDRGGRRFDERQDRRGGFREDRRHEDRWGHQRDDRRTGRREDRWGNRDEDRRDDRWGNRRNDRGESRWENNRGNSRGGQRNERWDPRDNRRSARRFEDRHESRERRDTRDRSRGEERRQPARHNPWGERARVHHFSDEGAETPRVGRVRRDERRDARHEASAVVENTEQASVNEAPSSVAAEAPVEVAPAEETPEAEQHTVTFNELGIGPRLAGVLGELGARTAFPIQAETIPPALEGRDVLGRARTGSGKTIAFGAPLVERLMRMKQEGVFANDPEPQRAHTRRGKQSQRGRLPKALIMAPTRELALQIDRTVQPLARAAGLFTTQLVGGAPIQRQQGALAKGVDIVIGTPGRIEDLIKRHDLDLKEIRIAVLDEADHMSELGFIEPVQRILRQIYHSAQKLLFSATLDKDVRAVVDEFLVDPVTHEIGGDAPHADIEHHVLIVMREDKDEVLLQLARQRTIIFSRTKAYAERITEMMQDEGVRAVDLHGDLSQAKRERNLRRFTQGNADVLIATDVAARGIHVDDIPLVVQADAPDEHKSYLHRSGRTGRAGNTGVVLTVVPRNRQKKMRRLLEAAGIEPKSFADFYPGDPIPGIDRIAEPTEDASGARDSEEGTTA